jgi:hypothetical protein
LDAKKFLRLLFPTLALFTNCANPVLPTGGNKDSIPPKILQIHTSGSIPKSGSLTITFNENIQLNNPEQLILTTPKIHEIKYRVTLNRLEISLHISDSLQKNKQEDKSYLQILPGCIQDLNEKNKFPETILVPLTQPFTLDSNFFTGTINNILLPNKTNLKAFVYNDTFHKNEKDQMEYTQIYDGSKFVLPIIWMDKNKSILFLDDVNKNHSIDTNEYYTIHKLIKDSAQALNFSYSSYPEKLKLQVFRYGNTGMITGLSGSKIIVPNNTPYHPDTALISILDTINPINIIDEHGYNYNLKAVLTEWVTAFHFEPDNDTSQFKTITINHTIPKENKDTIVVYAGKDSSKQIIHLLPPNKIITNSFKSNATKIIFNKLHNHINTKQLTPRIELQIPNKPEKLGTIQFSRPENDSTSYILYLLSKKYNYTFYFPGNLKQQTIQAPEGLYDCIIASDIDRNAYFTRASITQNIQEEPAFLIQNISIYTRLENTIIINNMNK